MVAHDAAPDQDVEDVDLDFLRASAREFLAGRSQRDALAALAAMDWTGLLVDESLGGAGWRPVEAAVVAEELGRSGDSSTWFGNTVAAAALATAPVTIRDRLLPQLIDGALAAGAAVSGDTVRVACGERIGVLVTLGPSGIHLFEVSDEIPISRDDELLDVTRTAWRLQLSGVESSLIGGPERADQLLAVARVLLSADSLGAVAATFERLVAYLTERVAFGAPIASFQAVQHRLVDLLVSEAKSRAIIMKAARALASSGFDDNEIGLSVAAHAFVTSRSTAVVDECMQLSGGIGFTWEYPLHHEMRRTFTNDHLLGTARASRAVLADKAGW